MIDSSWWLSAILIYFLGYIVVACIILSFIGNFLNKLNVLVSGKKTKLSYIPIFQSYILGELTINKYVGVLLAISPFFNIFIINSRLYSLELFMGLNISILIVHTILFVYAIIKYFRLKKEKNKIKKNKKKKVTK